jgi:hypothetical protein
MKKSIVNSSHYLALAVSAGILACSVLVFAFVYYQVGVQMGNTTAAYSQVSQAQSQEDQASQVVATISQTAAERAQLQSFFVGDSQTVGFITQIENTGTESGGAVVTIATISDDDLSAEATGTTGFIHAHIDIIGTWPQAMRALHLLESLPYGESIDNVRATPSGAKQWAIGFDLTAVMVHQ